MYIVFHYETFMAYMLYNKQSRLCCKIKLKSMSRRKVFFTKKKQKLLIAQASQFFEEKRESSSTKFRKLNTIFWC